MAKLKYDQKIVSNVLDYLDKGIAELNGTETDLTGAVTIVQSARGAEHVSSIGSLATVVEKPQLCIDLINNAINEINTRVAAIVQYNNDYDNAPLWKKVFGTIGMAASKIGEGFVGAFEDIGDAVLLVGAWFTKPIDAIFNTKASEAIINFQKRDLSRELFDWVYYDRDIAQYSAFGPDSLASSVFRGLGQATGYILMGGYVGGANNYLARVASEGSNISKVATVLQSTTNSNALVAAVGGLGSGSEDAFDHGYGLGAATLFGLKDAAIQGGMAYAAGKIGENQQVKAAEKNLQDVKDNLEEIAKYRMNSNGAEWKGYKGLTLEEAKAKVLAGAEEHYYQMIGSDKSLQYIKDNLDDIASNKIAYGGKKWAGMSLDQAKEQVLSDFAKRGDFAGEIAKLGGFTDRLTSKAYEKGYYDMQNLYTAYESAGKGASGIFAAATTGQMANLKNTATDIANTPGNIKNDIAAYRDYRAALKEARAAEAAGKSVPASVQTRIDKYLNNNRGLDMFRVSNVNPTNNLAKGGVLGTDATHAYKLAHTRATVGGIVGKIAQGTTAYTLMNMAKDSVGELGQTISQSLGMDTKLSRALFVDENRKYYDEDDKRPDLMPDTEPEKTPFTDPIPDTEPEKVPDTEGPGPVAPTDGPGPSDPTPSDPTPSDPTPSDPQPRRTDPTEAPVKPTDAPVKPTDAPTEMPTEIITEMPTERPTEIITEIPTERPTESPTPAPVEDPTAPPYVPEYEAIPNTRVGDSSNGDYTVASAVGALLGAGAVGAAALRNRKRKDDEEEEDDDIEDYTEIPMQG